MTNHNHSALRIQPPGMCRGCDALPNLQALMGADDQQASSRWVTSTELSAGSIRIENLDGVEWRDAPRPRRRHQCTAQSRGYTGPRDYFERCACGGIRLGRDDPWMERNSRR